MRWTLSDRADPRAAQLADLHYNRQKIGSPQFAPPGRCMVLLTKDATALWITSFPYAEFTHHAWAGAWMCSCFRNESAHLSSELIKEAVAATRWYTEHIWRVPEPDLGMITFVNTKKIQSVNPGYCYKRAGFTHVGHTKGGLVALQQLTNVMPTPCRPHGACEPSEEFQLALFSGHEEVA